MNAHLAQSEATATELEEIAAVPFQIVTPRHGKPVIGVVQDALAGSYRLTRPGITFNRREFMNLMMYNRQFDGTLPTPKAELARYTGQQVMSQLLPPINMSMGNKSYDDKDTQESPNYVKIRQGEILQGTLDDDIFGKAGKGIIHTTYNDYGPKQTVELLDAIQSTVESFLVLNGFSVGISDLVADEMTKAEVEKIIAQKKKEVEQIMLQVHLGLFDNNTGKTNQQEFEDQIFKILNEATNSAGGMATKSLSSENRLISMIKAGSKGNKTNIAQMVACLGQQAIEGKRITYGFTDRTLPHYKKYDDSAESRGFIESSFIRGLSPQEFFFHAMSGREGLIDTAVKTAETGYIQRQLIKALEDLVTQHDGTVRDAAGNIVQFHYGEDGTAATKIESQSLPFLKFSQGDIRKTFGLEAVDWSLVMEERLGVPSINQELVSAFVERAIEDQRILVEYVGKSSNLDVGAVQAPVNVLRCIMNTKIQFGLTPDGRTDLVPDVVLIGIERIIQRTAPYNRIWTALVRFYLAPHNIILKERFTRRAFDTLAETLVVRHMKSWAQPGEQVGIIAAQSIGEPATQMTLNSVDWDEKIMIACDGKIVCPRIGEFVDNYIKDNVNRVKTFPNNQLYVEMDQDHNWQAVSCDQSGIMQWTRLEAVTKHPVVNADGTDTILEVELECGRKVKATKGKSFLTVQDGKLMATNGSELQVGDSLPLATTLATDFLPKVAVFDLKTIIPPTKWIYGDEVERALAVMKAADIAGQRHWFSANNGTGAFTVPYSRSDGFRDAFVNGHNSRAVSGYFRAECVYPKSTRSSTSHIPAVLPLDREFGYLAGAYLAEGSSSTTQIQITNNDVEYLAPIEILLHKWSVGYHITKEVREIENTGIQGLTQSLVIHSTLLTEILTQLFGKKSYSKTFPDWVFQAPDEFVKGLVDGYIGGDGCVSSNSLSFGSVSEDLIVRMGTLLARYGLVGRISNYKPELRRFKSVSRFYKYTLTVFDSFKFAEIFTLTLKRKQERLDEILERGFRRFPNREVLGDVWLSKIKTISEVRPLRGEVYDLTVAETRNFLLLNTIACRDTFHLAGVASKSNVTRGVPRLRELLKVTKNPKATSLVIPLKPELRDNKDRAREVQQDLELTTLKMITNKAAIFWEPTEENVNEDDKEWVRFNRLIEASLAGEDGKEAEDAEAEDGAAESKSDAAQTNTNKWVIRLELNREIMFNKNISIQDVVFAINNSNQDNLQVSYTDYNADKLVIRIEEDKNVNSDYIGLKKFLNSLLITTVIRGIPGIKAVTFRKDNQILELKNVGATEAAAEATTDKKYEVVEQYILDTDGSNYIAVMNHPLVDGRRLTSTNVHDIYEVLGIEATRETLMIEINSLFNEVGVNYRHLGLLADVMTRAGRLMSADRYGINKNDIGPLAKMSFEETEKIVQKASVFGEVDPVTGVSANIMMGQVIRGGTAYSQILLDEQALARLSEGLPPVPVDEEEQDGDISDLIENAVAITEPCSTTQFQVHLQIPAAANIIEEPDIELEVI
jgi:DNA-directed RNA polymerase beta' subunit